MICPRTSLRLMPRSRETHPNVSQANFYFLALFCRIIPSRECLLPTPFFLDPLKTIRHKNKNSIPEQHLFIIDCSLRKLKNDHVGNDELDSQLVVNPGVHLFWLKDLMSAE